MNFPHLTIMMLTGKIRIPNEMSKTSAVGERTKERKHVREKDAARDRSMTNARQPVQTMVRAVCARTSIEVHVPSTPRNFLLFLESREILTIRHVLTERERETRRGI